MTTDQTISLRIIDENQVTLPVKLFVVTNFRPQYERETIKR